MQHILQTNIINLNTTLNILAKATYNILKRPTDNTFIQLLRYGIVGGVAFVADFGSLYLLTESAGLHYQMSAAMAFVIGLTVNYMLSVRWVFNSGGSRQRQIIEFLGYAVTGIIGLGINAAIMYVAAEMMALHYIIGKLISTVVVFLWNFIGRKILTSKSDLLCKIMIHSPKTAN